MIRLVVFPLVRTMLLAGLLGAALSSCAKDGRLDLKKIDLGKLTQADWIRWDRDKKPDTAKPAQNEPAATAAKRAPADAAAATRAAAPAPVARPGAATNTVAAQGMPRPRPWRVAAISPKSGQLQPRYRPPQTPEPKDQVAKAPQGKVTSEIPEALAVLPPAAKPPGAGGKSGKGSYSPNDLEGLDGAAIERLLGKPDLSRKEPFAEVWQYAHGDCVLFLFLYAQDGGVNKVSHAETSGRDGEKNPEPGQCIGAILARQAQSPG